MYGWTKWQTCYALKPNARNVSKPKRMKEKRKNINEIDHIYLLNCYTFLVAKKTALLTLFNVLVSSSVCVYVCCLLSSSYTKRRLHDSKTLRVWVCLRSSLNEWHKLDENRSLYRCMSEPITHGTKSNCTDFDEREEMMRLYECNFIFML